VNTAITNFIRERAAEDRLRHELSIEMYMAILEILKIHESWPVLMEYQPEPMQIQTVEDFNQVSYSIRQQIDWHTQKSYQERFGEDPPTTPIVLAYARVWRSHDDFDQAWA
jgi:hypothetical protein